MTAADEGLTELDVLSSRTATILRKGPPDGYRQLVIPSGTPATARTALEGLTPAELLDVPIRDMEDAQAMLAGLWLWFDLLDESHRIAQDIASPTGSYWHAIMHRREGDFSNAKYWYARCRAHRVNRMLGAVTSSVVGETGPSTLLKHLGSGEWDGSAFVNLVEAVHDRPDDDRYAAAVRLQQAEWQALFHHCVLAAAGSPLD